LIDKSPCLTLTRDARFAQLIKTKLHLRLLSLISKPSNGITLLLTLPICAAHSTFVGRWRDICAHRHSFDLATLHGAPLDIQVKQTAGWRLTT
jgi:hypothetical protein